MGKSAVGPPRLDLRSVSLQEQLRAKWRDEIRRRAPAEREAWLKSQEGIVSLGARTCRDLLRAIRDMRELVAGNACSIPWIEAWNNEEISSPAADWTHQRQRRYSAKMIISKAETRIGAHGELRRRFMPPQAVELEDQLDSLSSLEAAAYMYAESPSAKVIAKVGQLRSKQARECQVPRGHRNYRPRRARMDTWGVFRFQL
jgi:hypothetical protein